LEHNPLDTGWDDWGDIGQPMWNMSPERYRRKPSLPEWVSDDSERVLITEFGMVTSTKGLDPEDKILAYKMGMLFKTGQEGHDKRDQILSQAKAEREGTVREYWAHTASLLVDSPTHQHPDYIHVREVIKPEVSDE